MNTKLALLISNLEFIFWDFDGVIKESVDVKTNAYKELFIEFNLNLVKKIGNHHEKYSGVSRFEKIPLYLSWAGEPVTKKNIQSYCDKFSSIVAQRVIDSDWVPGVVEFIKSNNKKNIIVTATPHEEIIFILKKLKIYSLFTDIYGAPTEKCDAIGNVVKNQNINLRKALMIGDSESDYQAAKKNQIKFLLRCTKQNKDIQNMYDLNTVDNFLTINTN